MLDDRYKLYDLRVEVFAPPGAAMQCNAQAGDSFEVRGQMLQLTPGQGFSIVGARYADHLNDARAIFRLRLSAADHAWLDPILAAQPGPHGDTYALERDKTGRHGRIMKYSLTRADFNRPAHAAHLALLACHRSAG